MLMRRAHPLPQPADFIFGDGRQDVRDKVRNFAALADAVHRDTEGFQFLAAADPLQEPTPESIEGSDDDGYRSTVSTELAHVRQQILIARAVVTRARHHVLVLLTENPAMRRCIPTAFGELGIQAHPLAGLIVA